MRPEQIALLNLGRALQRADYAFVTVTPETHRRVNARAERQGAKLARSLRDVFGWSRPFERALLPAPMFEWLEAARALERDAEHYRSRVRFSTLNGSLYAHSAYPTLEPDAVFFGPDTHRFCHLLQRWAPASVRRVVDVGCGTGAGGLCLASRANEVVLADVNPSALAFAEVNAALASARATFVQSDVLQTVEGDYDLVIANPPYMSDAGERTYRDGGGQFGEALSARIVREALLQVSRPGVLIVYTGAAIKDGVDQFYAAIAPHVSGPGLTVRYEELDPDVFGEELEQSHYAHVERIAAVGLMVRVEDVSGVV